MNKLSNIRNSYLTSTYGIPLDGKNLLKWVENFIQKTGELDKALAMPPEFLAKLKQLTTTYSNNKTILAKHKLLNEVHVLCQYIEGHPTLDNSYRKALSLPKNSK